MSKPISRAIVSLEDDLHRLTGSPFQSHHVEDLAVDTIRVFLQDAKDEGRFDNRVIDQLLADLEDKPLPVKDGDGVRPAYDDKI